MGFKVIAKFSTIRDGTIFMRDSQTTTVADMSKGIYLSGSGASNGGDGTIIEDVRIDAFNVPNCIGIYADCHIHNSTINAQMLSNAQTNTIGMHLGNATISKSYRNRIRFTTHQFGDVETPVVFPANVTTDPAMSEGDTNDIVVNGVRYYVH